MQDDYLNYLLEQKEKYKNYPIQLRVINSKLKIIYILSFMEETDEYKKLIEVKNDRNHS